MVFCPTPNAKFDFEQRIIKMPFLKLLNNGFLENISASQSMLIFLHIFFVIISCVGGYLLGSINSAILISRLVYHEDIRKFGSGNAGMTNMLRTYGALAAAGTFIGDLLKTVIAVSIPAIIFGFRFAIPVCNEAGEIVSYAYRGVSAQPYCYVAGLFAVIGHIFPIYHKFKGGKGVMTLMTTAILLSHGPMLPLVIMFLIMLFAFRYMSLASVTLAALYPVALSAWFKIFLGNLHGLTSLSAVAIAILVVWSHRGNLKRIADKTERKLSLGKRKKADALADAQKDEEDDK